MQQPLREYSKQRDADPNHGAKGCLQRFADQAPYFLGVGAGTVHHSDADRAITIIGIVLHWMVWGVVVGLDFDLIIHVFNDSSHAYYHVLMMGAFVPLAVAAVTVTTLTVIHILSACTTQSWLNFNDGHLPGFLTTTILGSTRASYTFTLLLLSAAIFTSDQPGNEISTHARNLLIAQVVLKQIGISFTANAHRFATPGGGFCKAE